MRLEKEGGAFPYKKCQPLTALYFCHRKSFCFLLAIGFRLFVWSTM